MPKRAPELYQDRQASEELPEFLRRVYGQAGLLNGQLMTVHFDILDPPLAAAIRGYVGHYGALPDDINLPAKFERADKGTPRKQKRAEVRLTSG